MAGPTPNPMTGAMVVVLAVVLATCWRSCCDRMRLPAPNVALLTLTLTSDAATHRQQAHRGCQTAASPRAAPQPTAGVRWLLCPVAYEHQQWAVVLRHAAAVELSLGHHGPLSSLSGVGRLRAHSTNSLATKTGYGRGTLVYICSAAASATSLWPNVDWSPTRPPRTSLTPQWCGR